MESTARYQTPAGVDADALLAALQRNFSCHVGRTSTQHLLFYDTFDWRLYQLGWCLWRRGKTWVLERPETKPVRATCARTACFAVDFPAGATRSALEPVTEIRALLPRLNMSRRRQALTVRDQRDKIVVRMTLDRCLPEPRRRPSPGFDEVAVEPVRGYQPWFLRVTDWLVAEGARETDRPVWIRGLESTGQSAGDYTSKLDLQLTPDMDAERALATILGHLAETMEKNVPGLNRDIDTEFLHDFRVAIRRSRSALSQLMGVFSPDITQWAGEALKRLGQLTGPLRDLDVYLLRREAYRSLIPESLRDGLVPFFDELQRRRGKELARVLAELKSHRFTEFLERWQGFLLRPRLAADLGPMADQPVVEIARRAVWKRYRRILKLGRNLRLAPVESDLHRLRIHCKKLRYLFEFFASLMPPKASRALIRRLKRLQTELGDFNDLTVQQETLMAFVSACDQHDPAMRQTLLAVGALIGALSSRQRQGFDAFERGFDAVDSKPFRKSLRRAFGPTDAASEGEAP